MQLFHANCFEKFGLTPFHKPILFEIGDYLANVFLNCLFVSLNCYLRVFWLLVWGRDPSKLWDVTCPSLFINPLLIPLFTGL